MADAMTSEIGKGRGQFWARLGIYAMLTVAALYFLLPLVVMLLTSVKSMADIRDGHLISLPTAITFQPWAEAWGSACIGAGCEGCAPTSGTRSRSPCRRC